MSTNNNSRAVQPYLFFEGHCEEAIEFYRRAIGAEVTTLVRYQDSPEPPRPGLPANWDKKVMHASFRVGATMILASDGCSAGKPNFQGFSLSLSVPAETEAERVFNALAEGGEARMPLTQTFFSKRFGMVADRFGILWMVLVTPEGPK